MANKHRGEVTIMIEGKVYTLCFSIDAMCQLEDVLGKGIVVITQEFADPIKIKVGTARAAFWAALQEHHPEVTLKAAGELIPAAGGLTVILEKVGEAIIQAFPKPDENARPQKAARTGSNS